MPSRTRVEPTDDWRQLALLVREPAQRAYELIRPVVLFGQSPAERAQQTGTPQRTLYRQAARFDQEGMASLFGPTRTERRHRLPEKICQHIVALRAEHPALRMHEITTICWVRCGYRPSPRTYGRILAVNRKLYGLPKPERASREPKAMPCAAERWHQYWSVDIRQLDMANIGMKVYCVSILENYSRAILASGVFPTQDLSAYLMILYAAIRQHGVPETLVSDSGAVFVTAKQAKAIYAALGIEQREIERGKPWQNYIETTFNVQRRMADWDFAKATNWAELLAVHDRWVADYNYQSHWAHQERTDGRLTPRDVLGWVQGREMATTDLYRLFYRTRFGRKLDQLGYLRFRHWRVYGEHGLAKEHAALWLYAETLTIEFADEPVAQQRVRYQPDKAHLLAVEEPLLFETSYRSAQLPLRDLSDAEWLKVLRRPPYAPRKPRRELPMQAALPV